MSALHVFCHFDVNFLFVISLCASRAGSQTENWWRRQKVKFVFLYEEGREGGNQYRGYRVHDCAMMTKERMEKAKYPRQAKGDYFVFRFDEEVKFDPLNLSALVAKVQDERGEADKYAPIVIKGRALSESVTHSLQSVSREGKPE